MGQIYPAVAECDRPVHFVYVLTDLGRSAWNLDRPAEGLDHVAKLNIEQRLEARHVHPEPGSPGHP